MKRELKVLLLVSALFYVQVAGGPSSKSFAAEWGKRTLLAQGEKGSGKPEKHSPQKTYTDPITGMEFVYIPAGEFMMGSEKFRDSQPVHKVQLDGFYMSVYKVTVGAFHNFLNETGYKKAFNDEGYCTEARWNEKEKGWNTLSKDKKKKRSVDCVSWKEATAFLKWLSRKTGKQFRLPTEAQWEYVAHEGLLREFAKTKKKRRNFNYDRSFNELFRENLKPNAFGVYGMMGKGYEYCQDYYTHDYYAHSPLRNPQGPPIGMSLIEDPSSSDTDEYYESTDHVNRGGGYSTLLYFSIFLRSYPLDEDEFKEGVGFRLTFTPESADFTFISEQ